MKEGGRGEERRALRSSHEDIDMSSSLPLHSLLLPPPPSIPTDFKYTAPGASYRRRKREKREEDAGKTANV